MIFSVDIIFVVAVAVVTIFCHVTATAAALIYCVLYVLLNLFVV